MLRSSCAQGTTYLSGVDLPTVGRVPVASDAWVVTEFRSGTNPTGYRLNGIQISIGGISGEPAGMQVMIWDYVSWQPLYLLSGADPAGSGVFTYDAEDFALSPQTSYWLALGSATSGDTGSFFWNYATAAPLGNEGWLGAVHYATSVSRESATWVRYVGRAPQFAVNATPIPEPSCFVLSGLGGILLAGHLRRRLRRRE